MLKEKVNSNSRISAADVIGDSFVFVGHKLTTFTKQDILKIVQHWKIYFKKNNISSICLADLLTADNIAIFLACLELGIKFVVTPSIKEKVLTASAHADIVLLGKLRHYLYTDDPKFIKFEYTRLETLTEEYVPESVELGTTIMIGFTSGTTGTPKQIPHSVRSFLSASCISADFFEPTDTYAASCNFNHLGTVSMHVLGPIIAGVKFYTVIHLLDLHNLLSRRLLNKFTFFELDLRSLQKMLYDTYIGLEGTTMYCGGSSLSIEMLEWFFSNRGDKIYNFFGASECLPPVFVNEVYDKHFDVLARKLGRILPPYVSRQAANGMMELNGPGISPGVAITSDGYYNTKDYVDITDGVHIYNGRAKLENSNNEIVAAEVDRILITNFNLAIQDYFLTFADGKINIFANTDHAAKVLNVYYTDLKSYFPFDEVVIGRADADETGFKIAMQR